MRDFWDKSTSDMFGSAPLHRRSDPETSKTATKFTDTSKLEGDVLWAISQFPQGCIYDDVVELLPHIRVHSIQPRFAPLIRKNLITVLPEKRAGKSGRLQRVVQITS